LNLDKNSVFLINRFEKNDDVSAAIALSHQLKINAPIWMKTTLRTRKKRFCWEI